MADQADVEHFGEVGNSPLTVTPASCAKCLLGERLGLVPTPPPPMGAVSMLARAGSFWPTRALTVAMSGPDFILRR